MANNNKDPLGNPGLSVNLLPKYYQTPANKKFLQATVDQLFQPGTVNKVTGYVGKENAKAASGKDVYVAAPTAKRQNYQLEPSVVIKDKLDNVTFFKDYIDYINQLEVFGGNTSNHARLNSQEFYSWDPHIDWDKFVNFQNYYWLSYGPETISVYGQPQTITSTYTVSIQKTGNNNQYLFTPDGLTPNPVLKLYRGHTYIFEISSPGNPFSFRTVRSTNPADIYNVDTISANSVTKGSIQFTVPLDSPSLLFYQSDADINLGGVIEIFNINENTYIDVEKEIIGKKTYILPNGTSLSNGMKLNFVGNVNPASYATGQYYVEGVGSAIKLIPETVLEIIGSYTEETTVAFDATPFDKEPFSDATGYTTVSDYIVINRASTDHNPWSRYNRWFHQDVITQSAIYNNTPVSLDQTSRAIRPIIEFQADLKLFNFGVTAIADVDLVDDITPDVFSIIEGQVGYNIDNINVTAGQRILFLADTDPLVKNKIYRVELINLENSGINQLHLVEDSIPEIGQVVLIKQGKMNQSLMYWFNGTSWEKAQQKTATNQPPMFDVVDDYGISFGDISVYNGSTFTGTKLFSYKVGKGTVDTSLGFPLSYKNISNIGDIVFNFDLATDTFQYKQSLSLITVKTSTGYLHSKDFAGNTLYVNGWQTCTAPYVQAAVRIYKDSNKTNDFNIDLFDVPASLQDLDLDDIRVYVNSKRVASDHWSVITLTNYYSIRFNTPVALTDIVTIKVFTNVPINANGFYEIPVNLQNNPLNNEIADFTLGEVIDHVDSIIDNIYQTNSNGIDNIPTNKTKGDINGVTYIGVFPGTSNLRDLGNITQYGTKFVQHSGPASLSLYHITNESNNVVRAIEQARDDYNIFKKEFLNVASNLGIDADPVEIVDLVLQKINKDKPNTAPYYFSDMVPYGASFVTPLKVVDYRIKNYPLTSVFSLDTLSNRAVGVYLNGTQLLHGRDYTFNNQGFVVIDNRVPMKTGDTITTYEYENTDHCFVPATPTKLGIWPKYEPSIYLDTTLVTPRWMIQGHDGSQILAFGSYGTDKVSDYRDDVILELEKRIYNNIKVKYDTSIYDINDIIPGYNRLNDYSLSEFNAVLAPNFYKWSKIVGSDFSKPLNFDINNSFTYNYSTNYAPGGETLPGYWRGVYRWLLDTDRPNICPWEMLGFSTEPSWWSSVYGPAPYTSDNLPLWQDLAQGIVRDPLQPAVQLTKYIRPFLLNSIPVDEYGNLLSPLQSGMSKGYIHPSSDLNFVFGDVGPVESAWRRSSYYPFSVIITSMLLTPSKTFGLLLDRSRIKRNLAGQIIYTDSKLRIRPQDIVLPSYYSSATRVQTSGIINYLVDLIFNFIFSDNQKSYISYATDLLTMNVQLSYRVASFTNANQFNLLLESKTPSSTGNVFIPNENYAIVLNSSSPIRKLTYSGIIITKLYGGFSVSGYSQTQPYFVYYPYTQSGATINIGGITESYSYWTNEQLYSIGSIVKYESLYYRTTVTHTSDVSFNSSYFADLGPFAPIVGGQEAILRTSWNRSNPITVPYNTEFTTIQDTFDFIIGYGEWLKDQGFSFNEYNKNLNSINNWETSAKEFLFWTTQNWSAGQDKWQDWVPNQPVIYGTIVRYNGYYYSAATNIGPSEIFEENLYTKLDGLSSDGASVISLSPSAKLLKFNAPLSVIDDINKKFYPYEIVRVDGTVIEPSLIDSYRSGNVVSYYPRGVDSIYAATFYLIQHEHVVIIDNATIFNDIIYNPESGYRQQRIKVSGYITTDWYGGLDIPGFIFDQASVNSWQQWEDYNMGDIIIFQGYYYSANKFLPGTSVFNSTNWTQLSSKPNTQILPNWTNLATQFTDFYGLEVDSFDSAQQSMAQHLIGYQKRQYLNNIIQDDVSEFKFYQGMIREKGTQNVLNKLFDVLSSDNLESLVFYEEWALRVGQYGASTAFQQIEFILDDGLIKSYPQGYILVNQKNSNLNPFVIQLTPNDLYVRPKNYNSAPWPVLDYVNPLLRSAGYVNSGDVFAKISKLSDINNLDSSGARLYPPVSAFTNGSYVWCSFEGTSYDPTGWNVYRFTDIGLKITAVTYENNTKILNLTSSNLVTLSVGEWIGISQTTGINGFYQIVNVNLNTFKVSANLKSFVSPFPDLLTITVSSFVSQRTQSMDNLDKMIPLKLNPGELLWTDDDGSGNWATWMYTPAYSTSNIGYLQTESELNHGKAVAVSKDGNTTITSTSDGQISIYKNNNTSSWVKKQVLEKPPASANSSTISFQTYPATGTIVSLDQGSLKSTLSILSSGAGYTDNVYNFIPLIGSSVVSGSGAIASITITNGSVTSIELITVTNQYKNGDILSADAKLLGATYPTPFYVQIRNNCGSGYTPTSGSKTYYNIKLVGGSGSGAKADITVKNGLVTELLLVQGGTGYNLGDILTANSTDIGGTGSGFSIGVININANLSRDMSTVLAISPDNQWIAVGSPLASNVATRFVGMYQSSTNYKSNDIVTDGTYFYQTSSNINSNYTAVSGTVTPRGKGASFTIVSRGAGNFDIQIVFGGFGYSIGNRLLVKGSQVGGIDTVNDITITVTDVSNTSISGISYTILSNVFINSSGNKVLGPLNNFSRITASLILGSGATFNVSPTLFQYNVTINSGGSGYFVNDIITILASQVSGLSSVVDIGTNLIITVTAVNANHSILSVSVKGYTTWEKIPYIPVDVTATNSQLTQQGVVTLYKKNTSNDYNLISSIVSPQFQSGEKFGSNLVFGDNELFITAIGTNKLYTLQYNTIVLASSYYNPVGSNLGILVISNTAGIKVGMYVHGTGFTSGQYVTAIINDTTLELSGSPDIGVTPTGVLTFTVTSWEYGTTVGYSGTNIVFGNTITISYDNSTFAISSNNGTVSVFKNSGNGFNFATSGLTITGETQNFGQGITVSDDGSYLAISDDTAQDGTLKQAGSVKVFYYDESNYVNYQTIIDYKPEQLGLFGNKISFMNNDQTLVIYSKSGDTFNNTTFDNATTTFDKQTTAFTVKQPDTGRVDIYDRYVNKWVYSETLKTTGVEYEGYGQGFGVGNNHIVIGSPYFSSNSLFVGKVWSYTKNNDTLTWTIRSSQISVPDVSKIKKAFLYNTVTGELVTYLDIIDPLQGKIAGPAEEEIKYKTFYDPAVYSNSDTSSKSVNVDPTSAWSDKQVGMLWWNLSTTKFINSYSNDIGYRTNTWNTLAAGSSVDIYEWTSSSLTPSQWDSQYSAGVGIEAGITGQTLYGMSAYSVRSSFDKISQVWNNVYYFWVKNPKVTPSVSGRNLSAQSVASLIADPRAQGYTFLSLTGVDSFSLANVKSYLKTNQVALSIEYWTTDKTDQNVHSQWKIVSTDQNTILPNQIEQKWIDSLCGTDSSGRPVPDLTLPVKLRYGIENRPRQSMFVNQYEALKQFIEKTNQILISNQIVSTRNLANLESYDKKPSAIGGLWDQEVATDTDLNYINLTSFNIAYVTPVILNGKIVGITIPETTKGKGYVVAPYIEILGAGNGAVVRAVINSIGQVTGFNIISAGEGYVDGTTTCNIRSYGVLVNSDSQATGNWSIYSWDPTSKIWSRTLTQSYDVRSYWTYVDWYTNGYSQFSIADYAVNTFSDLNTIPTTIGSVVKIRNATPNGWILLEKYSNNTSIDWTQSYATVGIQNGTIQFNSDLYQFQNTVVGYDSGIYDGENYDTVASTELRIILTTIRDNILINELKQKYLELFFDSVRYIFSEQVYVDWIFKTSFVKAQHNVGSLNQPVVYPVDNLSNFEDYVAEVKPYKTKIREYVSNYESLDNAELPITDFDLMPVYENNQVQIIETKVINDKIIAFDPIIQTNPWNFWLTNSTYKVVELVLVSGGSGYLTPPTVIFTSKSGSGATGQAFIANGSVNRIVLLTNGTGYLSAPIVTITGGLNVNGIAARAVAIIGDGVVRSTKLEMKFDRIANKNYVTKLDQEETFTGSGSQLQFILKWAPDSSIGKSSVYINGVLVLRELYTLSIASSKTDGFTKYYGLLTFVVNHAPAIGSTIIINYSIDVTILNAIDRITNFYSPEKGQLGKDPSQIMTGIDYGGVSITGLNYTTSTGWGANPWYKDKWGAVDNTNDDYQVTVSAGTVEFPVANVPFPTTWTAGTEINVYVIHSYVTSFTIVDNTTQFPYNVYAAPIVVTAVSTVQTTNILTSFRVNGSFDNIIKVDSTAGIKVGMGIFSINFVSGQTVKAVLDSHTIELSSIANSFPTDRETISFSFNYAGSNYLTVTDTSELYPGQVVTSSAVSVFSYDTIVEQIIDNQTIKLRTGDILYANIPVNTDIQFTRLLNQPTDVIVYLNGTILLKNILPINTLLVFTGVLNPIRLDAADFSDITGSPTNPFAIIQTPITDGTDTFVVKLPSNPIVNPFVDPFTIRDGDVFILRKSSSDGSITSSSYDTAISGGDLAYSTATGLAPEDIVIDGDGFTTPTSSPATEEVVPGQVVDTVAIKVYDRPSNGNSKITVNNFIGDNSTTRFTMSQTPNSPQAVIVKIDNNIATHGVDYNIDYQTTQIIFTNAPTTGQLISVFNIGFNGSNILDLDYFVGDGVTTEFITNVKWSESFTSLVYIDGIISPVLFFKTDNTYDFANGLGMRFSQAPANGSLINFIIVSGNQQTFSVTHSEIIATDGILLTYNLSYPVGTSLPYESSMIVRVDNTILSSPVNSYFTIGNSRLNYTIDSEKVLPFSAGINQVVVVADNDLLVLGRDYTIDLGGITVKISKAIYTQYKGKKLIVSITTNSGYLYNTSNNTITFMQAYDNTHVVEVITSYNHSILDVQRTELTVISNVISIPNDTTGLNYKNVAGGLITLDRDVVDGSYVWIIKNNLLLVTNVDYRLNDDHRTVTLATAPEVDDKIQIITFGNNILRPGIAYMQFKDMLNRVHYKRLNKNKQTQLSQDLNWNDFEVHVVNASNLDSPDISTNTPGVIEIRGERIEYYVKNNNVLSQLRRGTLGTGIYKKNKAGTNVQGIGISETIPYKDTITTSQIVSDGTEYVKLDYIPGTVDEIEVFVGGYNDADIWLPNVLYKIGSIVNVGSYTYKCIENHIGGSTFFNTVTTVSINSDGTTNTISTSVVYTAVWQFFVGNIRLKKQPYSVHNVNIAPYSPQGDIEFPADFSVDGVTNQIKLTNLPPIASYITVIKRSMKAWDGKFGTHNILYEHSSIADFLRAEPGIWYVDYKND